jgi:hypothetical protein
MTVIILQEQRKHTDSGSTCPYWKANGLSVADIHTTGLLWARVTATMRTCNSYATASFTTRKMRVSNFMLQMLTFLKLAG